ncbi:nose resistant to fluoxetine protein 6-like [Sabethes cyaneus]|uniref:nose resistant to fluoxetine protein 6-like n=1 Tax=Sabethes cyaneus TaxID=53552 RepID=UPI00237ED741|nr:nose resistant to fluoxetine protein 6-like [Sabethes cyaneus]
MSEYWQMPPLFMYESFEGCLRSNPEGVFCIVKSVLKPNNHSSLWRTVEKYSKYPYQYQHSVLTRGICLQQCEDLVKALSGQQREQFLQPKFDVNYKYIINDWLLPKIDYYRQRYGITVNICQNYRMHLNYNLSAFTEIEHCTTNSTIRRKTDYLDICFYVVIVLLPTLAVACTIYDAKLSNDHNHYRTPLKDRSSNILTAFSLRRNINRLTIKLSSNQIHQDLRFLESIRVYVMTAITFSHVIIGLGMTTSQNPEAMEKLLSKPGVQMFSSLAPFEVDIFFAISGLLLSVHFLQYTDGKRFGFKPFWTGVVNRYLRSIPMYALIMLFTTSMYDRLQVSPSAYKIMSMVRTICREKWWSNLLFINNYYRPEEQCLIHSWYLASDFQLFIVGLVLMMIIWKYPSVQRPMVYSILLIGFILPMVNIYYHSMDAVMLLTNKGNAFQLWYDEWFIRTYQATEMHCLSYFTGMVLGIIYHKMQINDLLLAKSRIYRTLQYVVLPLVILFCIPAPLFQQYNFSKPSLWMSFYAGLHRLAFSAFISIWFLLFMFAERDSFFGRLRKSKLFENAFYRVLSRLSFGFYLIHMNVMKTLYGNHHEALRISLGLVVSVFCSATLITYTLALLAYVLVEKPCDIIFKQLMGGGGGNRGTRPSEQKGVIAGGGAAQTGNDNNNSHRDPLEFDQQRSRSTP